MLHSFEHEHFQKLIQPLNSETNISDGLLFYTNPVFNY